MKKLVLLALSIPILFSSCASMFTKTSYPLAINTTPSGASVIIIDKKGKEVFSGQTPAIVKLKSSAGYFSQAEYEVKFKLAGYNEKTTTIGASIEGWYFANILLGGIIGMLIVDPATGAMWKLDTEELNIEMTPTSGTAELIIRDINELTDSEKERLVSLN